MDVTGIRTSEEAASAAAGASSNLSAFPDAKKNVAKGKSDNKVSDPISINLNGAGDAFPQPAVHGAKDGEANRHRFKDVSDNGIAENRLLDCTSEEDVREVEEEGMSLEKYESEQLERAIERVKGQRMAREESVERYTQKKKRDFDSAQRAALKERLPNDVPDYLIDRMLEQGVPLTQENVSRAQEVCHMAEEASDLTDDSIRYLLHNEQKPTVKNLYHAKFSSFPTGEPSQTDSEWIPIEEQAKKILESEGYEWNDETRSKAQWLFENHLPVTGETMRAYDALLSLREGNDQEAIVDRIVDAMAEGADPEWASLDTNEWELAKQALTQFQQIGEEAVRLVCQSKKPLNLNNLWEAERRAVKQQPAKQPPDTRERTFARPAADQTPQPVQTKAAKEPVTDIHFIRAKRNLEEIRLKMTLQSAKSLVKKGIPIETEPLEKLVEELKEIENQYYQNRFAEVGVRGEPEEIDLLKETTETVRSLYFAPAHVLGVRFHENGPQTIRELSQDTQVAKRKLNLAEERYETLMTSPRKDMGDSIQKAFQNVDDILDDLGYEANEANRRAVRILAYNQIEINPESIHRMKEADDKVCYALKNLHPAVTVRLIKEDQNPLDLPIDELNELIRKHRDELGVTNEERFSKYLWRLERKEGLTEAQRDSYIGIYRMLHQIERMDGAVVGALIEAGGTLTLNHLMTSVRTFKSGGVKAKVNDEFGSTWSVSRKGKSITQQASAAFSSPSRLQHMASDALDQLSPDKWLAVLEEFKDQTGDLSLEALQERLAQTPDNVEEQEEYYRQAAERVRELFGHGEDEIGFLKSNRLPVTLYNIAAVRQMSSEGKSAVRRILERKEEWEEEEVLRLEETAEGFLESLTGKESMQEQDDKLRDSLMDELQKRKSETTSFEEMRRICTLEGEIRLRSLLSKQERYEIPLLTEHGVTSVNLTVIRNGKDKGRVQIDVDSPLLGKINADFNVKDKRVKGTVFCEDSETQALFGNWDLPKRIRADGFETLSLNVGRGSTKNRPPAPLGDEAVDETPDTKSLYRLAKNFIQSVHALEQEPSNEANRERNVAL